MVKISNDAKFVGSRILRFYVIQKNFNSLEFIDIDWYLEGDSTPRMVQSVNKREAYFYFVQNLCPADFLDWKQWYIMYSRTLQKTEQEKDLL